MPITNHTKYVFNQPIYLNCAQQESYPQSKRADAVVLYPGVGYTYTVVVLSDSDKVEESNVGFSYQDNTGLIDKWHWNQLYNPGVYRPPVTVSRGTQSQDVAAQIQVSIPSRTPNIFTINGVPSRIKFNHLTNFGFSGDIGNGDWFVDKGALEYNTHIVLQNLRAAENGMLIPGKETKHFFVNEPLLIELPGIRLVRTLLVQAPVGASKRAGLPLFYQSGYVVFGRLST